jgi:hypothetical protein
VTRSAPPRGDPSNAARTPFLTGVRDLHSKHPAVTRENAMNRLTKRFAILMLLAAAAAPLVAQSRPGTGPSGPIAKAAATTQDSTVDGGWPRPYLSPAGASIVLYQPQVASWPDQKHMTIYLAVSYLAKGKQTPTLGALRVESDTSVALDDRLVSFSEFTITEASFPTIPKDEVKAIVDEILASIPREQRVIALDRVLAMVDTSQVIPRNIDGVKADPPPVFFSQTPAVLINLDGPPIWSPIPGTDLRFAVNTNWDLFRYPEPDSYYLRVEKSWLTATSVEGPWHQVARLPASFSKLPDDGNWTDVRGALQPQTLSSLPTVFVSEKPAELLLLNGPPKYEPVTGTGLMWVSNTDADVFRLGQNGTVYYLVAGRWFSAPDFSGRWAFATPTLPEDFKRIPLDHPRSRVLASVPGTRQAIEAVLLAQIPQTATVNRHVISSPAVTYQGAPQFEPIEKTSVARAVNTDKDILKVGDTYYMCFDGIWFVSKAATGPWGVADTIPPEIYQIPISSPAHDVTYVTVESANDDEVTFEAAAPYTGMMVAWGTAVWGSGWYYPPYYYPGAYYPTYYPFYPTYGYGARYNPWTGAYSRGGAIYGPYGGAGYGARYNPTTGTWARGAAAYGPAGARGAIQAYNPRTGAAGRTVQGSNVYGSWGSTAVRRGDQWAQTARLTRNATGTTSRVSQSTSGGEAFSRRGPGGSTTVGRTSGGDVYAGHDGSIYRNQGGTWQKYSNGGWSNAERPTGTSGQVRDRAAQSGLNRDTVGQLNQDRNARIDGAQRTSDFNRAARSGSGSYRPSGGGRSIGGGGFRGGGGGFRGGGRR